MESGREGKGERKEEGDEEVVVIREFNDKRGDREMAGRLEKKCEMIVKDNNNNSGSKDVSICTNTISADPLCRVRFYPLHVMLVAELRETGEIVGVVRGCIKSVGTSFGEQCFKFGCMLGLRVSPTHRRIGIGLKLVKSLEDWMAKNEAEYVHLATEKNNHVAMNLFTLRCGYSAFSSLSICICPVSLAVEMKEQPQETTILEKLPLNKAVSFYETRLKDKDIYPTDIDTIFNEKLSLGTWVLYFKDEDCENNFDEDDFNKVGKSWVVFSIWNTSDSYKLQIRRSQQFKLFTKVLSCLGFPFSDSDQEPFGFLFLYGLYGEGERVGELIQSMWKFAATQAKDLEDCKVVMTELGATDPLREHIMLEPCTTCINDVWCLKRLVEDTEDNNYATLKGPVGNVFVDPRDF